MSAAATLVAYPVTALVLYTLLRTSMAHRFVAAPREDRWHKRATPYFGGIGIFAGLAAGVLAALAIGAVAGSHEQVLGILAGCAVIFAAGLLDDLFGLTPIAKLAAQLGASAIVLSSGLTVTSVTNHYLALAIATLWLVGLTNAFNMLDNMDGLAAILAAVAALFFAIDAATIHPNATVLVLSLALFNACLAFLPFNLRREGGASLFMGDSGSQVLGFTLASCGIAATSAREVAQTTIATLILPLLILAVPILDTTLVTVVRLFEGRPIHQGGRDHTSHRLVYHGLSDKRAVILLASISAALGATSLTYTVIDDKKVTVIGVLLTFAFIVQFASFLADVDRSATAKPERREGLFRSVIIHRRRFVQVVVDGVVITAAFYGAYVLRLGDGTPTQWSFLIATLPVLLFARYLVFIPMGLYRGVWRYADARDAVRVAVAVGASELITFGFMSASRNRSDFPRAIFVIDAVLCYLLVVGARFWERAAYRGVSTLRTTGERRRALVVGAGRSGRSFARELRETPGVQVVGFVDDDIRLRRRRLLGTPVLGTIDEMPRVMDEARPDVVFVAIPNAPSERLELVTSTCHDNEVECQLVRRELETVLPVTEPDQLDNVTSIHRHGGR
jgi:UDP-GlcNAc:undecaprenyl-phosphate/decaprenyl-phosphate GlcNAc-1-phosphate transferase